MICAFCKQFAVAPIIAKCCSAMYCKQCLFNELCVRFCCAVCKNKPKDQSFLPLTFTGSHADTYFGFFVKLDPKLEKFTSLSFGMRDEIKLSDKFSIDVYLAIAPMRGPPIHQDKMNIVAEYKMICHKSYAKTIAENFARSGYILKKNPIIIIIKDGHISISKVNYIETWSMLKLYKFHNLVKKIIIRGGNLRREIPKIYGGKTIIINRNPTHYIELNPYIKGSGQFTIIKDVKYSVVHFSSENYNNSLIDAVYKLGK